MRKYTIEQEYITPCFPKKFSFIPKENMKALQKNEPKKNRVYSVASCSLPFRKNTMISTFSQYADVTESLYRYIEKGVRIDCQM